MARCHSGISGNRTAERVWRGSLTLGSLDKAAESDDSPEHRCSSLTSRRTGRALIDLLDLVQNVDDLLTQPDKVSNGDIVVVNDVS